MSMIEIIGQIFLILCGIGFIASIIEGLIHGNK